MKAAVMELSEREEPKGVNHELRAIHIETTYENSPALSECLLVKNTPNTQPALVIRPIRPGEAALAAAIEQVCFPPNEAAKPEIMELRAQIAPELFFVAEGQGQVIGFTTALAVDQNHLVDDYFTNPSLHKREGKHVMILSLAVLPDHQRQGVGGRLIQALADYASGQGKESLVLTCLEQKVAYYASLGFTDLGESDSAWGGDRWHEMVRKL